MIKERLEEINQRIDVYGEYDYQTKKYEVAFVKVDGDDFNWLIQQAERVQELEEEIGEWISGRFMSVKHSIDLQELEEQNEGYRSILDDILEHAGTYGLRNLEKVELKKSIKWAEGESDD